MKTIGISDGKHLSIPQYLKIVRLAKQHPDKTFERSFCGWWPSSGKEILWQFREGVHDRINKNGGLKMGKSMTDKKIAEKSAKTFPCECRWCGSRIDYKPKHNRFCDDSCRKSYN